MSPMVVLRRRKVVPSFERSPRRYETTSAVPRAVCCAAGMTPHLNSTALLPFQVKIFREASAGVEATQSAVAPVPLLVTGNASRRPDQSDGLKLALKTRVSAVRPVVLVAT